MLRVFHLLLLGLSFSAGFAFGQPMQREWVRNYSSGQTNLNQAKVIKVTPDGNIVVAGTSQNEAGDLDYQLIKYKPNGDEAWRARYGSPNQGNDDLRGMTVDPNGNVILTGTSATVKFNPAGDLVWATPLPGRAVVANGNFVYVTGFSEVDIATAQLENNNVDGKELWRRSVDGNAHGPDIGQAITLDGAGNVFVGGQLDDQGCIARGTICLRGPGVVSYTSTGVQRWIGRTESAMNTFTVQATSIVVHPDGSVYLYGSYDESITAFLAKFDSNGVYHGNYLLFATLGSKLVVDSLNGNIVTAGRKQTEGTSVPQEAVVNTFTDSTFIRKEIWSYLSPNGSITEASDIAQDSKGNLYVAGYAANSSDSRAMLAARLTTGGQQLGLDRYNSPSALSNFGTALAIDKNDNAYVTGYMLNAQGGSEFVTVKYTAAPAIEKKTDGVMRVEFHTTPGQQYAIEATTDFFNWQSLITNTADLNGLIQFDDTDAPTIPYRFYRGNSAP